MATSSSATDLLRRSAIAQSGAVSMVRSLCLLLAFTLGFAGSASGQDVHGRVMDLTSEQPIASALVMLIGADHVVRSAVTSDAAGAFVLNSSGTDSVRVRVQRAGYAAVESLPLALSREQPLQLEIRLRPTPVALAGVTVTAPRAAEHARFLTRQRTGFGEYLDPADIAKINPKSTTNLLLGSTGVGLRASGSGRRLVAIPRGGNPARPCIPTVFLDGTLLPADNLDRSSGPGGFSAAMANDPLREKGISIDAHVPVAWLRAVEVYARPANAPPEFQRPFMKGCPVVILWTAHGFGELN